MLSNETTIINGMVRNKNEYTKDGLGAELKVGEKWSVNGFNLVRGQEMVSVQLPSGKEVMKADDVDSAEKWAKSHQAAEFKDAFSKTKDDMNYKGYLIKEQDGKFKVYESGMNSLINTFSSLQEAKDFLDLHGNQELAKDGTGAFASGELKKADKKLHKPLVSVGKN